MASFTGLPADYFKFFRELAANNNREWFNDNAVRGDALSRPPRGFGAGDPMIGDIKRKSFFAMAEARPAAAKKPVFADDAAKAVADAGPMMKFLCDATGAPF